MALCEYELQREKRMAENRRRMEEMGLFKVMAACHSLALAPVKQRVERPCRWMVAPFAAWVPQSPSNRSPC